MKYFLHDSNAFHDEKISLLYIDFGYEGLGLFYTILEKLAMQEKPIKTIVLKKQLGVGKKLEKCWAFMENIDIISSNNGETFNKHLLNYAETYKIKKEKNAKRILEWRENQSNTKNVTHSEQVGNTSNSIVSKGIVEEDKEIVVLSAPVELFDLKSSYLKLEKNKLSLITFFKQNKPDFPEPYFDLWNYFSDEFGLPQTQALSESRKNKLKVRIKDKNFNFLKILTMASKSDFIKSNKFFNFDWVIENDKNYLKVIEGNYNNK